MQLGVPNGEKRSMRGDGKCSKIAVSKSEHSQVINSISNIIFVNYVQNYVKMYKTFVKFLF